MSQPRFTCTKCKNAYPWFMKGGTNKLIADPMDYADRTVTECAYCVGVYADSHTLVSGGRR